MSYDMTVEETFQRRITTRKYLNGIWTRVCFDIEEVNDEIQSMIKQLEYGHDILDISSEQRGNTVVVNVEYARPGKLGRLHRNIVVKKHSECRVNQDLI